MANKAKKSNNKGLIIGICAAIVVLVVVIVAVILGTRNGGFGGLNDSYFVSDDSKYVLTIDSDTSSIEEGEHVPIKSHLVYNYSGDEITGLKAYYEYANAETAKAAYDYYKSSEEAASEYKSINLDGKYVILEANENQYQSLTASDVKAQIDFFNSLKNIDSTEEDSNNVEDTTEE